MPMGRQQLPQIQAGLLVAWLVVAGVDQVWRVPPVVVGLLAIATVIVLGTAVMAGWRRRR